MKRLLLLWCCLKKPDRLLPFLLGIFTVTIFRFGWPHSTTLLRAPALTQPPSVDAIPQRQPFLNPPPVGSLDYDPVDYDPERIQLLDVQPNADLIGPPVAMISAADDGMAHLRLSSPDIRQADKRVFRPRFLSDEVNLKKKLVVGVTTRADSPDWRIRVTHICETMQNHVDKVVVFVQTSGDTPPQLQVQANVVTFKPAAWTLGSAITFQAMQHLASTLASTHEFFFLIPDTSYVNVYRLIDLTDHLSCGERIFMGVPSSPDSEYCDLEAGIIVSSSVIKKVRENEAWCSGHWSSNASEAANLGRCVRHSASVVCRSSSGQTNYSAFKLKSRHSKDETTNVISVYPVQEVDSAQRIHQTVLSFELKLKQRYLSELEREMQHFHSINSMPSHDHIGGVLFSSAPWPPGSNPMSLAKNHLEFDSDVWTRFHHTTHVTSFFEERKFQPLANGQRSDLEEAVEEGRKAIERVYPDLNVLSLQSAWSRFDWNRGTDYIFMLATAPKAYKMNEPQFKWVHVFRELSAHAELIDLPFVTENSNVSLLIGVKSDRDRLSSLSLIKHFVRMCSNDHANRSVHLVMVVFDPQWVPDIQSQIPKGQGPNWSISIKLQLDIHLHSKNSSWPAILDHLLSHTDLIRPSSLILIGTPDMNFQMDFLNRVRMNTIAGYQIFCPIPWVSYHPKVVEQIVRLEGKSAEQGYFDNDLVGQHVSFYLSDYLFLTQQQSSSNYSHQAGAGQTENLCNRFQRLKTGGRSRPLLRVLSAPEPSLRIPYWDMKCADSDDDHCWMKKAASLGPRLHLGSMLLQRLQIPSSP